jgi:hypothetical protein
MTAFEVVSKDKRGAQIITRHYTDRAVLTEMHRRESLAHTGVDWRAIEVQLTANVAEKQPKPGKGRAGR